MSKATDAPLTSADSPLPPVGPRTRAHLRIHAAAVELVRRDEVLRILMEARQRDERHSRPGGSERPE